MLETIFSWLVTAFGDIITWIVQTFLACIQLDLQTFVNVFPIIADAYVIFRSVAIGLVLLISAFSLYKFFLGGLDKANETPVQILIRAFVATALIFWGGYLINWVVNMAKVPYDIFVSMTGDAVSVNINGGIISGAAKNSMLVDSTALAIGAPAVLIIVLVVLLVIGWNILKLMIEVIERFLVVGVLTYTAPLAFSTIASGGTSSIFKKWLNMLISECILMFLSVWSLDVILSGFSFSSQTSGLSFWMRLLMTFAMMICLAILLPDGE